MIRNILVPLDGSDFGARAIDWAALLAKRSAATLHLVHVRTPLIVADPMLQYTLVEVETAEEAQEYIETVLHRRGKAIDEVAIKKAVLEGSVVEALCRYTQDHGIELVVMTTHGRGPWAKFWEGSTAESLVRSLPVSILLLRATEDTPGQSPPNEGFQHILMPVEQNIHPDGVGGMAFTLARLFNARVTLLHVCPPNITSTGAATANESQLLPPAIAAALEATQSRACQAGIPLKIHVVSHENPAGAIVAEAAKLGCDLIAMETRCRTGIARWVRGSTADRILQSATVPVLLHCSRHSRQPSDSTLTG
jgi:nucleotide-binding universal stress UspA family protein